MSMRRAKESVRERSLSLKLSLSLSALLLAAYALTGALSWAA